MPIKNRFFERIEPERSAQKMYIFCEGADREYRYFRYFEALDSHLHLIVYRLQEHEDNSPLGLYQIAEKTLLPTANNPEQENIPIMDYRPEEDLVWIVLDTDKDKTNSRHAPLLELREKCVQHCWQIAQSNPCFEVWLYYHQESEKPDLTNPEVPKEWKILVDSIIKGGFDPRKHPIWVQQAIQNAKQNFERIEDEFPAIGTTEVYLLAKQMLAIGQLQNKIQQALKQLTTK